MNRANSQSDQNPGAEVTEIDSAASLSGMSQHSCSPMGKAADAPVC